MGQKINPVSLRLQYTNRYFDNCWYSNYFYKSLINKDLFLQNYLNNFLKLLKLPTARYSIHHLQKKTQVYNFFCYSKSTRLWRSGLFGLTKKRNFSKKNRFFFKNKKKFKNIKSQNLERQKFGIKHLVFSKPKNKNFYGTLNQQAIKKIQKRITTFQNFQLWSALKKTKSLSVQNTSISELNWNNFKPYLGQDVNTRLRNLTHFISLKSLPNYSNGFFPYYCNLKPFEKLGKTSSPYQNTNLSQFTQFQAETIKQPAKMETNSIFLQNLLIYKIFKSQLNKKNNKMMFQNLQNFGSPTQFQSNGNQKLLSFSKSLDTPKLNLVGNGSIQNLSHFEINCKLINKEHPINKNNFKYKNYLESSLSSLYNLELNLIPFKVKNDWQHASFLADEIVYFLQKRIAFRRLKGKIIKQLSQIESIRGVRITCSGRVGGKSKKAQRSKTECLKYGQTSLQVFSSKIDFSLKTAFTSFGSVGVKVWICYN